MPKKTSWITSLVITIIPFVSAIITNLVSPPDNKNLYYVILGSMMVISWLISAAVISNVSKSKLRKLNLLPKTDVDVQSGYWKILYGHSNCSIIACSLLKLTYLDDFESYEAQLTDFNYDNSINKIIPHETYTCRNVFFNEDKKIVKVIFESGLLESRQDDFVLEYSEEEHGKLKRITSRCLGGNASENGVSVGFCFGEISRISEADIESYGIRKREEVKKAYRQGLITPEQLIAFLNNCYEKITTTSTYKNLAANVMLEKPSSGSKYDTNKDAKDSKKRQII